MRTEGSLPLPLHPPSPLSAPPLPTTQITLSVMEVDFTMPCGIMSQNSPIVVVIANPVSTDVFVKLTRAASTQLW